MTGRYPTIFKFLSSVKSVHSTENMYINSSSIARSHSSQFSSTLDGNYNPTKMRHCAGCLCFRLVRVSKKAKKNVKKVKNSSTQTGENEVIRRVGIAAPFKTDGVPGSLEEIRVMEAEADRKRIQKREAEVRASTIRKTLASVLRASTLPQIFISYLLAVLPLSLPPPEEMQQEEIVGYVMFYFK